MSRNVSFADMSKLAISRQNLCRNKGVADDSGRLADFRDFGISAGIYAGNGRFYVSGATEKPW